MVAGDGKSGERRMRTMGKIGALNKNEKQQDMWSILFGNL